MMEEPEMTVAAKNVQFKCSECDQTEQVIYIGGPRSGLIQCAHCGKVLWHGKSSVAIV